MALSSLAPVEGRAATTGSQDGGEKVPTEHVRTAEKQATDTTGTACRLPPSRIRGDSLDRAVIQEHLQKIEASETGRALLTSARESGGRMVYRPKVGTNQYNWGTDALKVRDRAGEKMGTGAVAHELAHGAQDAQGLLDDSGMSPEQRVILNRFCEADAQARAVQTAWEMKEAGDSTAWNAQVRNGRLGPTARAFGKTAAQNPDAAKNGTAMRAAFDAWFTADTTINGQHRSNRNSYDRERVLNMRSMLSFASPSEYKGMSPAAFNARLKAFGKDAPGGGNYIADIPAPEQGRKTSWYALSPEIEKHVNAARRFLSPGRERGQASQKPPSKDDFSRIDSVMQARKAEMEKFLHNSRR